MTRRTFIKLVALTVTVAAIGGDGLVSAFADEEVSFSSLLDAFLLDESILE